MPAIVDTSNLRQVSDGYKGNCPFCGQFHTISKAMITQLAAGNTPILMTEHKNGADNQVRLHLTASYDGSNTPTGNYGQGRYHDLRLELMP